MERRAGRAVGPEGCDPLEWELLLIWEARQYEHEALARSSMRRVWALFTPAGAKKPAEDTEWV